MGNIVRGSRKAIISRHQWRKKVNFDVGKYCRRINIYASVGYQERDKGVRRRSEESVNEYFIRSISGGGIWIEGVGYEYMKLINMVGVKIFLLVSLNRCTFLFYSI